MPLSLANQNGGIDFPTYSVHSFSPPCLVTSLVHPTYTNLGLQKRTHVPLSCWQDTANLITKRQISLIPIYIRKESESNFVCVCVCFSPQKPLTKTFTSFWSYNLCKLQILEQSQKKWWQLQNFYKWCDRCSPKKTYPVQSQVTCLIQTVCPLYYTFV